MNLRKLGVVSLLGGITAWNGYECVKNLIDYYQTSNTAELGAAVFYGTGVLIIGALTGSFASVRSKDYDGLERELLEREEQIKERIKKN